MSARNRKLAIAGCLVVVALVVAIALRAAPRRGHRVAAPVAPPVSTTTPVPMRLTAGTDPAASAASTAGVTSTGTGTGSGTAPQTAARQTGPYANGSPARLDVAIAAPLDPLPPPDAGWHPLAGVHGTGNGASATFHITSSTTQVRFRSTAADFHTFVVDQVQGREATAGYADVDCAGPCADVMELSVRPGDYHVEVDATGPWELSLEEYAPTR